MACPSEVAMRHIVCYIESSSRRGAVCLSERGSRSGEKVSPKRDIVVSHYFTLAQVKRSSLSETNTLAWVKALSLSENNEDSCFRALIELVD
ncbi:hypothetical protein DEO72_LG5g2043 [Vigna unguiculata]|uniref:Uncharacterized protein n=1 Tax=Vigna unguiculata TaxID=3917 RepID=A0A4D6M196_VIGUN|nr:hypothetical protein DEO72_LG5g2043 [Vigna unguiculata]